MINLQSFFRLVFFNEITGLEVYNYVEEITTNFDKEKLRLLEMDFSAFIGSYIHGKDQILRKNISNDEYESLMIIKRSDRFGYMRVLDYNYLFDINDEQMFRIITFVGLLHTKQEQLEDNKLQPLIWLKSKSSLSQLFTNLYSNKCTVDNNVEEIINSHFLMHNEINSTELKNYKVSKICWFKSQNLLVYLLVKLEDKDYLHQIRAWNSYVEHFSIKLNDIKISSLKSAATNINAPKPKDSAIIDSILENLD